MPKGRFQVIARKSSDLARDHIVNTLFFDVFSAGGTPDYDALATDLRAIFNDRSMLPAGYGHEVKVYDMADPLPRPVVGSAAWAAASFASGESGPREVACCLSYYGDRNLKRQRGRIFVGPWRDTVMAERPNLTVRTTLQTMAEAFGGLGGVNVDWQQHSVVANNYRPVTDYWIDDEWDTMRSRGLRATTRLSGTVNE